jgi:tRNA A-37 threonylcarbamoyl transferase component Bud32/DNA-directed RNA polymerase subunit RPC12/RpoP
MPRDPGKEDVLIGRLALASGKLTRDRLDECIHLFEASDSPATLGEVFLERGYLTVPELRTFQELARRDLTGPQAFAKPADPAADAAALAEAALFGRLALAENLITPEQLFECLDEQLRLEKDGRSRQIGELMVAHGYLRLADVSRLLGLQKKTVLQCPNCEASFTMTEEAASKEPACQHCGAPLSPVRRLVTAGATTTAPTGQAQDALIGKIFSGCQIIERIGRGGMGTVYKGRHLALNKLMAIKILAVSINDPEMIERFVREARSCARLEHPNIIQVHNVGRKFGHTFILMQLVDGHTLGQILEAGKKISVGQAIKIVREVARGLGYAHRQGIVHRDVKPDNIFITSEGELKVGDFGLAMETRSWHKTDTIQGTPFYMPPEQWRGEPQDGRSDIYALGITFYALVTGGKPFEGESAMVLMEQHMHDRPRPPSAANPDVPRGVSAVIMKMIEKKPADRYQSCEALLLDLDRIAQGREPEAPPDPGDFRVCSFCQNQNRPDAKKCAVCGEYLATTRNILMEDEFPCPACGEIASRNRRSCDGCGQLFCKTCRVVAALKGTDYCKDHQVPPPQFAQRRVRRS